MYVNTLSSICTIYLYSTLQSMIAHHVNVCILFGIEMDRPEVSHRARRKIFGRSAVEAVVNDLLRMYAPARDVFLFLWKYTHGYSDVYQFSRYTQQTHPKVTGALSRGS